MVYNKIFALLLGESNLCIFCTNDIRLDIPAEFYSISYGIFIFKAKPAAPCRTFIGATACAYECAQFSEGRPAYTLSWSGSGLERYFVLSLAAQIAC